MGKGHFVTASEGLRTIVSGTHVAYFKSQVKLDSFKEMIVCCCRGLS